VVLDDDYNEHDYRQEDQYKQISESVLIAIDDS